MALSPGQQPPSAPQPPPKRRRQRCQSCGTQNAPAAHFCMQCGTSLSGQPQPVQQPPSVRPPSKVPKWLQKTLEWVVKLQLVGVIVGLLPMSIMSFYHYFTGPPPDSIITTLMAQEVQAATTHDLDLLTSIYDPRATVVDTACLSPSQSQVWSGLTNITSRYSTLLPFASLEHAKPSVVWVPDDSSATTAYASATTIGVLAATAGNGPQPIRGHEQWAFTKSKGQWLITLFAYNFCLP
jgi:zinc-ribbon domain